METPPLTALLTTEQQQQLAEWLNGIIPPIDHEKELLRIFTPKQVAEIINACYEVRAHGYGRVELLCTNGRWDRISAQKQSKF